MNVVRFVNMVNDLGLLVICGWPYFFPVRCDMPLFIFFFETGFVSRRDRTAIVQKKVTQLTFLKFCPKTLIWFYLLLFSTPSLRDKRSITMTTNNRLIRLHWYETFFFQFVQLKYLFLPI